MKVATPSHLPGPHACEPTLAQRVGPFVVLGGFVVALLYPLLLRVESLYWGDIFIYFYPLEQYVRESLRAGSLPQWNPYVLCGQPLIGNPQSWVFYPSTVLLPFVPVWLYFTLNTAAHLSFAGAGTYLFVRRLCPDRLAALLGAITFVGSGFLMARLQFPTMVMAATWLPWMLLLVERIVERADIRSAALLAIVIGLELLAAHTQLAYLGLLFMILYAGARIWPFRRDSIRMRRILTVMGVGFVLGILVAMVQILPSVQLFTVSTREHLTWMQANRFVLLPEQLLNFVAPNFFGDPARGDYWGEGNRWEPCIYVGITPLVLAGYAVWRAPHRGATRFFAVMGLLSLWLAMGRFGGLYWLAYHTVPGLASFHDPARFTFLMTFALAVLAAMGLRALSDRGASERVRLAFIGIAALNLWAFSAHLNPTLAPSAFGYRPRVMAVVPKEGTGRVFTAFRDQVWKRYLNYSDFGPESVRYAHEFADTLAPNFGMRFGVEEGSGYEPVPIRALTEVDALARIAIERQSPMLPALLGLFNAHTLLLPQSSRYRHPALEPQSSRGVTALALSSPMPRAWLVRETVRIDGTQRSLAALSAAQFDPRRIAVVSGSNGLGESFDGADLLPPPPVRIYRASPGHFDAVADASSTPAFLVWSAAAYPGWSATVDDRPARLERTDHAFMGLVVPAGRHRIRAVFEPSVFCFGLYLTLLALTVITAALTGGCAAHRTDTARRNSRSARRIEGP